MPPLLPNERHASTDGRQRGEVGHSIPDSDDSEHEQVKFIEDYPKLNKSAKPIKPVTKRPPRHKQKKLFATKEHMISLIEKVCSAHDAVIQQKRGQEGEALKRQAQRNETIKARKGKREEKLEKVKDRLRNKKGGRHAKNGGKDDARKDQKDDQPKKDYRGHKKKKRVSFRE